MTARVQFDHLAVGVRRWSDTYDRFARGLGGRWVAGTAAGPFAPGQLGFGDCLKLEFIAPTGPGGFMDRFFAHQGPRPHHLTFKVPSMDRIVDGLDALGLSTFGDRPDRPGYRELFLHHRVSSLGTLVQFAERDELLLAKERPANNGRPDDFPEPERPPRPIAFIALSTSDLDLAHALLADVLEGTVTDKGRGWFQVSWGPGRAILVRTTGHTPGGERFWADAPDLGVAFVLFGPPELTASGLETENAVRLPHEERTGITVWLHQD